MRKKLLIFAIVALMITPVYGADGWTANQTKANQIANIARSMGLPENNPIIIEASHIWWEEENNKAAQAQEELDAFLADHEQDIRDMAGTMFAEARGLDARECSMVAWCVLNRYDTQRFGSTIHSVLWAKSQFAHSNRTVSDQGVDLVWLARDVLTRWYREQKGETEVGRTLPQGYCYYYGNGRHNLFRMKNSGDGSYNFGLLNPYA